MSQDARDRERLRWSPVGHETVSRTLRVRDHRCSARARRPDMPESVCADGLRKAENLPATVAGLAQPAVIWENHRLEQFQDDMDSRGIPHVDADGTNSGFVTLAADRPTVIIYHERRG